MNINRYTACYLFYNNIIKVKSSERAIFLEIENLVDPFLSTLMGGVLKSHVSYAR